MKNAVDNFIGIGEAACCPSKKIAANMIDRSKR
ncbi:hypothetical protein SAMN05414139_04530 [Burkholderia sp. D7]|nr:hypothetical protein SAMN05414139_04530 [Burkholderia sp. D7]